MAGSSEEEQAEVVGKCWVVAIAAINHAAASEKFAQTRFRLGTLRKFWDHVVLGFTQSSRRRCMRRLAIGRDRDTHLMERIAAPRL